MADSTGPSAGEGAHLRWDELAVGHVLGGLDDVDRALFREHLTSCDGCRARVSELRSLAAELEQAAALAEGPEASTEPTDDGTEWSRRAAWHDRRAGVVTLAALVAGLLAILYVVGTAGRNSELVTTARLREATLEALGSGSAAETTLSRGVRGIVVASEVELAWSLTDLPELTADERVVIWLLAVEDEGSAGDVQITTSLLLFGPEQVSEGRLAGSILDDTTDELRVTIETFPLPSEPTGPELVRAWVHDR